MRPRAKSDRNPRPSPAVGQDLPCSAPWTSPAGLDLPTPSSSDKEAPAGTGVGEETGLATLGLQAEAGERISPVLSTKTKALLCAPSSCKRVNEVGLHELWRQKCVWVWNQRMCADSGVWSDPARRIHRDVEADESLSRISNLSSSAGFTKWRITEIGGSFVHRSQFPAPVSRLVQSLLRF